MSQEDTEPNPDIKMTATDTLMGTFKMFLHNFMLHQNMSAFGPTDHLQELEEKTGIHVSFVMVKDGHMQMTTTVPLEALNKYLSFSMPGEGETIN